MHDVLIIGSGAAGLSLALSLPRNYRILVLSKSDIHEGSTLYAQGGISAVLGQHDSIEAHISDTLNAGAGLCDPEAVRFTVENGATAVNWLLESGVNFTRETGDGAAPLHLTREGGHSYRRIAHAADATGREIETTLVEQARTCSNITLLENHIAIDLITTRKLGRQQGHGSNRCVGAYILDRNQNHILTIRARFTVLATGGASKAYLYTSNPDGASGDGIAMAWRAGCRVANMEFMQFHPTCLYHPHAKSSLITEAVRGEGGHLLLPDGERFMPRFDPRAELAPRDIVARAIDHEMKRLGADCLYLDISHRPRDFILAHFPNVYATCLEFGYDMTKSPIPVVPAAHYTCGGVMTNPQAQTDVDALYCIGETAYTGLHGANRMASNSLLECIVYGKAAAEDIMRRQDAPFPVISIPAWDESRVTDSDEHVVITHNWDEIRRFMWDYVGIVRTTKRLERAHHRIELLLREIDDYYANFRVSSDLVELRNLSLVAWLIIRSALARKESRGLHYTLDYPEPKPELAKPTIIDPLSRYLPY
ncbi:MAG TPA: L-aspartate oxidase [Thiolinea sp.]|nr:L-aspartate oxidase [Thiolinea sp.]